MKALLQFTFCTLTCVSLSGCKLPPLQSKIAEHDTDAVITMLNKGADVESPQFRTKRTALMIAAKEGDPTMINILLQEGADANARDLWDNRPLNYAVWGGHQEVLQLILAADADVNVQNIKGWTPLMHAALNENASAVQDLLTHGADVHVKRDWPGNQTALSLAEYKKNTEITQLLREAEAKQTCE